MAQFSVLSLSHVSFTHEGTPEPLFDDVNATFPRGWSAILGGNGIGKSTLAHLITGRLAPDQGAISPSPRGLVIAYCPQRTDETPEGLEDFAADWSPEAMMVREALGLDDEWCYRYDTLSGGEAKRVQVACALASRPDVLVLDEPTNHVDEPTRNSIARVMRSFHGIGIVISHDVALIDATCKQCVCFERRHIRGRNVTQVITYAGGYSQMIRSRRERERNEADALSSARRETARLLDIQTARHTKVQQAEAAKHQGRRVNPKDHDARAARKLARSTSLDSGVGRAYAQFDGRVAAARAQEEMLTTAAKRYAGNIWMDVEPSHRPELVRLESGVIRYGETVVSAQDAGPSCIGMDSAASGHVIVNARLLVGSDGIWRVEPVKPTTITDDLSQPVMSDPDQQTTSESHESARSGRSGGTGEHTETSPYGIASCRGLSIPTLSVGSRDHVVITGPNGLGKSTLVRALVRAVPDDVSYLYIAQKVTQAEYISAMKELERLSAADRTRVLAAFAQLNADPDELMSGRSLSPGESRKLMLCLGLIRDPQLIIMDEPTNHLDLSSKEALNRVLRGFRGAVIVVSHELGAHGI